MGKHGKKYEKKYITHGLLFFAHFELICFSIHEYLNTIQKYTESNGVW